MSLTPEEKLLKAIFQAQEEDRKAPVFQVPPVCPSCWTEINLNDPSLKADYRDVKIGNRLFLVCDAYCPVCSVKIEGKLLICH
jgi:hypothetical protein